MIDPNGLLMIEPQRTSSVPVIDELTRKMVAAWRQRRDSEHGYRGIHVCTGDSCGRTSDNRDHFVCVDGEELVTNSLAVHYIAFHRDDVPQAELDKVARLDFGEEDPTDQELGM